MFRQRQVYDVSVECWIKEHRDKGYGLSYEKWKKNREEWQIRHDEICKKEEADYYLKKQYELTGDYFVYVLLLGDLLYVGSTKDFYIRIHQHIKGNGGVNTRDKHIQKIALLKKVVGKKDAIALENIVTQKLMIKYPEYTVRGGYYTTIKDKSSAFRNAYLNTNYGQVKSMDFIKQFKETHKGCKFDIDERIKQSPQQIAKSFFYFEYFKKLVDDTYIVSYPTKLRIKQMVEKNKQKITY